MTAGIPETPVEQVPRSRLTFARRWSLAGSIARGYLVGLLICIAICLITMFVGTNLHVVVPGAIYRSSQVSQNSLDRLVRKFGIRTVINLRGTCADQQWYREECLASSRAGISQEDLGFSAGHLPPVKELHRLVEVLDRCEYPILFHCYRGVDRTGLATAIVLLLKTETPLDEARRSLGLRYLHLPFGHTGHLDRFLDYYEDWLERHSWEHTPERFRAWVTHEYRGGNCNARIELLGLVLPGSGAVVPALPLTRAYSGPNSQQKVRIPRGVSVGLRVRCHNTSDETWQFDPGENAGIHAFWRQVEANGMISALVRGGRYHAEVPPGSSIDLTLAIPPYRAAGFFHVQVGLIDERHCFMHEVGLELLDLELEVP